MNKTKIEYCDYTWNPVTGCLHECPYCYARSIARRFGGWNGEPLNEYCRFNGIEYGKNAIWEISHQMARSKEKGFCKCKGKCKCIYAPYPFGFEPTFHKYRLDEPAKLKTPAVIFVCSMADLFGEWVPEEWIKAVFNACAAAPQHTYLFLTKKPSRYYQLMNITFPSKSYFGMTATDQLSYDATLSSIRAVSPCMPTWLSLEPISSPIDLNLRYIAPEDKPFDWVAVGAETGSRKGKIIPKREWIEDIVQICAARSIPLFMKNNLAEIWGKPLIQETP